MNVLNPALPIGGKFHRLGLGVVTRIAHRRHILPSNGCGSLAAAHQTWLRPGAVCMSKLRLKSIGSSVRRVTNPRLRASVAGMPSKALNCIFALRFLRISPQQGNRRGLGAGSQVGVAWEASNAGI